MPPVEPHPSAEPTIEPYPPPEPPAGQQPGTIEPYPPPGGDSQVIPPDGDGDGIPNEYGDGADLDANGVPDEIGINPDALRPGYPNPIPAEQYPSAEPAVQPAPPVAEGNVEAPPSEVDPYLDFSRYAA